MTIIKENPRAEVRWVEEDGWHAVTAGSEVLVRTRVESLAKLTFEEAIESRDPARALLKRERAHWDVHAARWEGFGERSTKNHGRGGKGGRGGV